MIGYLFLFYVIVGVISFALFGVDKRKATHQRRRISENMLLISVACGGRLGGVIGMSYFRHKTIKSSFLWKFWLLIVLWIILTFVALFYMEK